MPQRMPNAGDYGLLLLLAAIWGSAFAFTKIAVTQVPPASLTAIRLVLAALVLLLVVKLSGRCMPQGRTSWLLILMSAVLGNAVPFTLIAWGQQGIASGTSAILMGIMPLVTIVIAHFATDDEKLNLRKTLGMVAGFGGLLLLVGPSLKSGFSGDLPSLLAILTAATCYGLNAVIIRHMPPMGRIAMVASVMMVAAFIMVPTAFIIDQPMAIQVSGSIWAVVIFLGVLHTAIAALIMFTIIARAGASFFSQLNLLIPLAGVAWGFVLLSERPGLHAVAALILIILGIIIARGGLGLRSSNGQLEQTQQGVIKP